MNPQNIAADPKESCFVTANAGSGKTSTLVNRVARLLLHGARPEHILCVTYTKAAAAEMQSRLYERLGAWAVTDDTRLSQDLNEIGEPIADLVTARALFAKALETPGGLKIQTLHAFCEKLLRRFPLEAGLYPAFQVLDDLAAKTLSQKAMDGVLTLDSQGGHRERLIVKLKPFKFTKLLMQFVFGHDKIKDRFDAIKTLAHKTETPWEAYILHSLGLKDARRPEQIVADFAHSLNWMQIRELASSLAVTPGERNKKTGKKLNHIIAHFDETKSFDLHAYFKVFFTDKALFSEHTYNKDISPYDRDTLHRLSEPVLQIMEVQKSADTAYDTLDTLALFEDFSGIYSALKRQAGALDFHDLINRSRSLLLDRAMSQWVLYKMDGGLEHILVDEAQDTSQDQWDILKALSTEFFDGSSASTKKDRTVFAVGDEKQSIYGFQGAEPDKFLSTRQYYLSLSERIGKTLKIPELKASYRSQPEILSYVDAVYDAPELSEALNFTQNRIHHEAKREGMASVELWPPVLPLEPEALEDIEAQIEDIDPVDKDISPAPKRLAQQLAAYIRDEIAIGRAIIDKETRAQRPVHPGDILILVRQRNTLFEHVIRELKQVGVPVSGADRLKLSDHIAFQDLRALMRFCVQPSDDLSLACILRSPLCDLSEEDIFGLCQSRSTHLWAALNQQASDNNRFQDAVQFLGWALNESKALTAFDMLGRLLNRKDSSGATKRQRFITRLGVECEDVLDETLNLALKGEGVGANGLIGFLDLCEYNASEIKREQDDGAGRVRVMTVHGSKGLEAPWVILPMSPSHKNISREDLLLMSDEGDIFLSSQSKASDPEPLKILKKDRSDREAKEGLRLLYVALTRARDRLTLCGYRTKKVSSGLFPDWYDLALEGLDRLGPCVSEFNMTKLVDFGGDFDPKDLSLPIKLYGAQSPALGAPSNPLNQRQALPSFATEPPSPEPVNEAIWKTMSHLTDDDRTKDDYAPSPLSAPQGLGRFGRGLKIHKLFEILPDISHERREAVAINWLKRQRDLSEAQQEDILVSVMTVLNDARFHEVFGQNSRPEVALAGQVATKRSGEAIYMSGRIDRLVVTDDYVLIVDYKSNRPAPDRAEDAGLDYQRQMAGYVALLRQIYPFKRIEAALVWTDGPKLTPLSDALVNLRLEELAGH
jgi:ATP-dependent helicase/nuclease subunit A